MSPSAIRHPRAVKPSAKTAERGSTSKEATPESKKSAPKSRAAGAAKPSPVKVERPAAPKKAEPQAKLKPQKLPAPLKKNLVVDVEKPKKKAEKPPVEPPIEAAAEQPVSAPAPKRVGRPPKAAKAMEPGLPVEEAPKRGRKASADNKEKPPREKVGRTPKMKPLDPIDEFLADDLPVADEDEVEDDAVIPENLEELDPLDLPLALLDPELVEVPRPAGPTRPKPKPRVERHPKQCASCGNTFTWLSVDQLCFNCLKKRLAAKKREDESYGGFTPEAEEDDSD